MSDERRERVRERIEAARERVEQRAESAAHEARDAATAVRDFVKEHPAAAIAGGLAVGGLVAAMLPRRKRRSSTGEASRLAAIAGELAVAYATRTLAGAREARREGSERLGELGETVSESTGKALKSTSELAGSTSGRLGEISAEARRMAADFAEAAIESAREASENVLRKFGEATSKLRD
ncbi:MAG: DUF883 family protein [Sphingomonadales bacterium]|nr:DUF883 family protein [Sphingomonadales bacterium]